MFHASPCDDCGPHAAFHRAEYLGAVIARADRGLTQPCDAIWRGFEKLVGASKVEKFSLALLRILARTGLGVWSREPHPHECSRTRALREEAERRQIDLQEFRVLGKDSNHFLANWQGQTLLFDAVPRPKNCRAAAWMDEKNLMREAFAAQGIPIAKGGVCVRWKTAAALFDRLERPVIIKPHTGSRSRHTTVNIHTHDELRAAFLNAKRLSPWIIIEEQLVGALYRGTVIGGKTIAVLRRDAPRVIGNGIDTVRTLHEKENALPLRHNGVFEPIPADADTERELARQGLTWDSIPADGQTVIMYSKFGRGQGSLNEDVTAQTHPDNLNLLEDAARVINDPLIGMDFIMSDISRSWKEQQRLGIIECNSAPFLDLHHYPYLGKSYNAAGALWELVFPGSGTAT